jgi:hypothetical protein
MTAAQGTEARRAETPKSGSVHDGPVAKPCAQSPSRKGEPNMDNLLIADELEREADLLENALVRYGYSDKRETDRGELLESIGRTIEALIRKASQISRNRGDAE